MAIPINAASAILTGDKKPEDRGRNKRQVEDPAPTPPSAAKPNTRVGDISSGVPDPAVTPPPRELPEGLRGGNKGFTPSRTADRFPSKRPPAKRPARD